MGRSVFLAWARPKPMRTGASCPRRCMKIETAQEARERLGESASTKDGETLASACRSLIDEVAGRLAEEEKEVVPVASRAVTPQGLGALAGGVLSHYSGSMLWLPIDALRAEDVDSVHLHQVFAGERVGPFKEQVVVDVDDRVQPCRLAEALR